MSKTYRRNSEHSNHRLKKAKAIRKQKKLKQKHKTNDFNEEEVYDGKETQNQTTK